MSEQRQSNVGIGSGGVGFTGLLTIVFVTLKLTGTITWSWWWVLSPLWISLALWIALAIFTLIVSVIVYLVAKDR